MKTPMQKRMAGFVAQLITAVLLLLPAGCGFHLKGYQQASPALNGLYVAGGERRGSLAGTIQINLRSAGVELADAPESARYRLQILRETMRRRVLSVDANGKALDSEFQLQATYRLTRADGGESIEESLELVRQLSYSGADELGQRNEAALMTEDMRSDLAHQIIRQLQARLK